MQGNPIILIGFLGPGYVRLPWARETQHLSTCHIFAARRKHTSMRESSPPEAARGRFFEGECSLFQSRAGIVAKKTGASQVTCLGTSLASPEQNADNFPSDKEAIPFCSQAPYLRDQIQKAVCSS